MMKARRPHQPKKTNTYHTSFDGVNVLDIFICVSIRY